MGAGRRRRARAAGAHAVGRRAGGGGTWDGCLSLSCRHDAAAELARREGLFDWLAIHAVAQARGSRTRLFVLVYLVGTAVTALLSNDATAVVLTPAVYAATRAARAEPLPYLLACAFIANAASFVLPISNPANLVVFGAGIPRLTDWLILFTPASIAAIVVTFVTLWLSQAKHCGGRSIPFFSPPPFRAAAASPRRAWC